jgi:hypothetical protein
MKTSTTKKTTTLPKKIESIYPPVILHTLSGTYAIYHGQWFSIPKDTSYETVKGHWVDISNKYLPKAPKTTNWTWQVKNSKGNGHYTVTFDARGWNCNCAGFGFRRSCRHINETKVKQSL